MATQIESTVSGLLVDYRIQDAAIGEMRERLSGLKADTKDGYEEVRKGIGEVRSLRVAVEKRRVELKADALEYGRKVDAEAKRITAMLLEIEEPLKLEKQRIDDEKERKLREAQEAERKRIEAELAAKRAEEEARLKAEREAEAARLKAEQDRLAEERRQMEERLAAEREAMRKEQERLEAERKEAERKSAEAAAETERQRRELEDQRRRLEAERAEADRRERERLEAERAALERERAEVERQRREAEEREALQRAAELQAQMEAAEAERRRQLLPDAEKIRDWATRLADGLNAPQCQSPEAQEAVAAALEELEGIAEDLREWCDRNAE